MHRRSYYPDSVNQQITLDRATRRAHEKYKRAPKPAAPIAPEPTPKPSLFARIKRVMTMPISLPRIFRSR